MDRKVIDRKVIGKVSKNMTTFVEDMFMLRLIIYETNTIPDELLDVIIAKQKKRLHLNLNTRLNNSCFTVNLPSNIIHHLQIYGGSLIILDINNLPSSIKSLSIEGCNYQSLDYLPISLETLKIDSNNITVFTFSLDNLPVNLKNLFLRINNFPGSLDNLPDSIENLFIDFLLFNQLTKLPTDTLKNITIPKNLISLTINIGNDFQINLENLSETLEYLEIQCNPKYLEDVMFPKNLKYLAINNYVELNYDKLSKNLDILIYFDKFDEFSFNILNTYKLFTGFEDKITYRHDNIDMIDTFQKIKIKNYSFNIYVYNSNAENND